MIESSAPSPVAFFGWIRRCPRGRWTLLCRALTERAAWGILLGDAVPTYPEAAQMSEQKKDHSRTASRPDGSSVAAQATSARGVLPRRN